MNGIIRERILKVTAYSLESFFGSNFKRLEKRRGVGRGQKSKGSKGNQSQRGVVIRIKSYGDREKSRHRSLC